MGQYLQFQAWMRTSSGGEKILAGAALSVVVALTAFAVLPTTGGARDALVAGGVASDGFSPVEGGPSATGAEDLAAGSSGSVGSDPGVAADAVGASGNSGDAAVRGGGGSGGAGNGGGASGGEGPSGSGGGDAGNAVPAGQPAGTNAPAACARGQREIGVTDTTVTVAAVLLNLGGAIGNGAVGVSSPEQQQAMTEAVVADLNARGGAACRKIVVKFFEANPLDPSSAQRACLDVAEAGVYAVVDGSGFAYPQGAADCVAQRKIPIVSAPGPTPAQFKRLYPYYMSMSYDPTQSFRNTVVGMKRLGYFDAAKGFKKLGLFMDDCSPEINKSLLVDLAKIGIAERDVSIAAFSCPSSGFASPSDANGAVVKHRQDGVTHVIPVTGGGSFKSYSSFAEQQGFRPSYTSSDYNGFPITTTGSTGPDRDNFDGTVAITSLKIGMESSGFTDPVTEECKALYKRRGVDPNWVTNGFLGGTYCNMYKVFAQGATKAPRLSRVDLHRGVGALGKVPMAYIDSDAVFSPTDLVGGDFYWAIHYSKACNCWKVLDRTRRPGER